ncbi:alpha/beta hydrolase [Candidatus Dependentiae bacterium]
MKTTIIIKKIILIPTLFLSLLSQSHDENLGETWHFNTQILRDHEQTKQKLLEEDFRQVSFTNEDNKKIGALLLEREGATFTMICTHGFCPGGKEGFAPLVKIAPKNCNLLFLDLRGYGQSPGPRLIPMLKNYGKDEYKDIISAARFVGKKNPKTKGKPIIFFGWCSGGYHSLRTVLEHKDEMDDLNVKGVIFDSGFASVMEISEAPKYHFREKYIPGMFSRFYGGNRKKAKSSYICQFTTAIVMSFLRIIELFIKPSVKKREPKTNLHDKIHDLKIPVFVIHAKDDTYAKWKETEKLVKKMPKKDVWLIDEGVSYHAQNHIKLKKDYKKKMESWTNRIIP